jgi:lipoprotein-anchoring transpeptidase ErfK/SrfK
LNGYQPTGPARLAEADYDRDGLSDRLELLFESDPMTLDTNLNGKPDGEEIRSGISASSTVPFALQKSLFVSLKKQQLEMRVNNIAIATHPVSGGLPRTPTPIGTFKILQKNPRAWSSSAKLWMPYWMHFSGRGHGFHELPEWPGGRKEGENHLGRPASHGCVRLGIGAAKAVYDWSPVGTPVTISKL